MMFHPETETTFPVNNQSLVSQRNVDPLLYLANVNRLVIQQTKVPILMKNRSLWTLEFDTQDCQICRWQVEDRQMPGGIFSKLIYELNIYSNLACTQSGFLLRMTEKWKFQSKSRRTKILDGFNQNVGSVILGEDNVARVNNSFGVHIGSLDAHSIFCDDGGTQLGTVERLKLADNENLLRYHLLFNCRGLKLDALHKLLLVCACLFREATLYRVQYLAFGQ